jgi:hypothetical protein
MPDLAAIARSRRPMAAVKSVRIGGHDRYNETSRETDQRLARRLAADESTKCFGRVCRSPQNSTAANTANIATTQTVTSKESVGMRLISCDGESMPASLDRCFDLDQTHRGFTRDFSRCSLRWIKRPSLKERQIASRKRRAQWR